jgi:hypothetical protein
LEISRKRFPRTFFNHPTKAQEAVGEIDYEVVKEPFMPDELVVAAKSRAFKPAMILQIDRQETPLQFPAVIRNLAAGVVTLEVNNPWTILDWETLKGQEGRLRLLTEAGKVTDLRATINWARYCVQGQDSGNLNLSLQLTDSGLASQKLLSEYIAHTSNDIKGFWNQYDQAQVRQITKMPLVTKIALATLALLLTGLALQLSGATGVKLWG